MRVELILSCPHAPRPCCVLFFFLMHVCVCYLLCNTSLPAMFRNLASISARQGPSDRARESDGGQMKGGRQREGGERARASRGGLEFPAAIRNGDRDGKRERPIHTVGFFPHLKSVYLYFSFWFLFCTCAFFFGCVKPIDSGFLKKLLRRLVRV